MFYTDSEIHYIKRNGSKYTPVQQVNFEFKDGGWTIYKVYNTLERAKMVIYMNNDNFATESFLVWDFESNMEHVYYDVADFNDFYLGPRSHIGFVSTSTTEMSLQDGIPNLLFCNDGASMDFGASRGLGYMRIN